MPTEFTSWPDQVRERILCPGSSTGNETEINNFITYNRIGKLLAKCPEIFADEENGGLAYAYEKIGCGEIFQAYELARFTALLSHYELLCEQQLIETAAAACPTIIASGSLPISEGAEIVAIEGMLITDTVIAILMNADDGGVIDSIVKAAGQFTINYTGAEGGAIDYIVVRPCEEE